MTEDKVCALFHLINLVLFRLVWYRFTCVFFECRKKTNLYLHLRPFIIRCFFRFIHLIMLKWVLISCQKKSVVQFRFGSMRLISYDFWHRHHWSCANLVRAKQKLQIHDCHTEFLIFGLHIFDFDLCEHVVVAFLCSSNIWRFCVDTAAAMKKVMTK